MIESALFYYQFLRQSLYLIRQYFVPSIYACILYTTRVIYTNFSRVIVLFQGGAAKRRRLTININKKKRIVEN